MCDLIYRFRANISPAMITFCAWPGPPRVSRAIVCLHRLGRSWYSCSTRVLKWKTNFRPPCTFCGRVLQMRDEKRAQEMSE